MTYTFGVDGCNHLGYAAHGMAFSRKQSWNQRVVDGHVAATSITDQMIEAGCKGHINNGDGFHISRPLPRDVEFAHRRDDREYEAGMWRIINSGNHDAGSGSEISAAATMHRTAIGAHAVYPKSQSKSGPHPGLYEIHQPDPAVPIYCHVISHYGLDPTLPDRGISINPIPRSDGVNILLTHGILITDDALYKVAERHGEDRIIPTEWLREPWDAVALSDYHTQEPVHGFDQPVWWTGSALRRGWSDEAGPRGWLRIDVDIATRAVTITPQHIWQRPQFDLEPIDARGATVTEIDIAVRDRLSQIPWMDEESLKLTGHGGPIVRQLIVSPTPQQRQGINERAAGWSNAAKAAAHWTYNFENPLDSRGNAGTAATIPLSATITDFPTALDARRGQGAVKKAIDNAPDALREDALNRARRVLGNVKPTDSE